MKQFKELNEVINSIVKNLGIENQLLESKAIVYWPKVAGPQIAENTKAEQVKDGKLFIKTKNDVWRNELLFYKTSLIKRLNEKIGKQIILDIILL